MLRELWIWWWRFLLLLGLVIIASPEVCAQHVVINEVMASNATTIADEDGDFEDWIELYNAGGDAVNLLGYGLSDDYGNPYRWVIPNITIQPGEFLLIWASGKNRSNPANPVHTNFSISAAGEEVLITHPDGTRIDELGPIPIPTDISYGRKPDGGGKWFFFAEPTPGAPNTTDGSEGILEAPVFSATGGFYTSGLQVVINHPDPDATIVYTRDGSEPCIQNLPGTFYQYKNDYPFNPGDPFGEFLEHTFISEIYSEEIAIEDRTQDPDKLTRMSATVHTPDYMPDDPVYKGTVIRARAFKDGFLPSNTISHSYFITPEGHTRFSLPVIAVSVQENYLFDYHNGIYTPGVDADQWRIDNPGEEFAWPFAGNFHRRGVEWEYPAHIELFDQSDKERVLAQDIGIRIHGGATRSFPMKSLRLYARNRYGNSHLNHAFFGMQPQAYKRLILRNSGNDFPTDIWRPDFTSRTMFRDAAIQHILQHMRFDTQAYRPAILFLNGEYWGLQNIRERYDKHYLHRKYGVDEENIDMLTGKDEVQEGDNLHYKATIEYIETHGVENDVHYAWVLTRIDEQNFMDYQIANIFVDNTDWPGNNIDFWRLRTSAFTPGVPYGHDGRWRWLLFDMDFGFGLVDLTGGNQTYKHNTLDFATTEAGSEWPNPPWSTFLLRSMLKNETFRHQFINRFADQLNTAFLPERAKGVIQEMQEAIAPEIEEHYRRWGYPEAYEQWLGHVEVMIEFAEKRPYHQRQHILQHFDLDGLYRLSLDVSNQLMGHIRVNTVDIESNTPGVAEYPYPWLGRYFVGVPVKVSAIAAPGFVFSHWEGASGSSEPNLLLDINQDTQLSAHFMKIDTPVLIHYWLFDTSIPNDTPLMTLDAFYGALDGGMIEYHSALEGYPFDPSHPMWRKASMERRNQPTAINYRPEGNHGIPYHQANMRGLQIRQPFADNGRENTMILHMPTTGFTDIILRFAARDEGAAETLLIDYQTGPEDYEWTTAGISCYQLSLEQAYQLYEIDFSQIPATENNPHFKVRIRFDGDHMHADDGERVTFNNISLDGVSVGAFIVNARAGTHGNIYPSGRIALHQGEDKDFLIVPFENHFIEDLTLDGASVMGDIEPVGEGGAKFSMTNISDNHKLHASFSLNADIIDIHKDQTVLYPNPANEMTSIAVMETIQSIHIINLSGQVVYEHNAVNALSHDISTGTFRNGMYIVVIRTGSGTVSKKLQVMR